MLDKVFKAYDIRSIYPDPLNEDIARRVGYGTGRFLADKTGKDRPRVAVGRDMRPHSPSMAGALMEGLRAAGADVADTGMVDTSFIYFAINHLDCDGGVQTTASHNPIEYNGFKISGPKASPVGADTGLNEIKQFAASAPDNGQLIGGVEQVDLWDAYAKHIKQFLHIKRPLRVVVDASNGMAGTFIPRVFEGLDGLEIIPLNMEMTGSFNHDPNPLVPENMEPTQQAVRQHGADFGVCFDGDADRCILCDEQGHLVGCDLLGAVMAEHFSCESPGDVVVYDLRSSKALKEAIESVGGKPVRGRVGHVFMKKLMREHNAVFGAELSGHMYYRDNFHTDSGAITFAVAITLSSQQDKPLSSLIAPHARYAQSGEMNFKVEDKQAVLDELKTRYAHADIDELDGVSIDLFESEGWWANVRASNTEPLLRLNLEGRDKAVLKAKLDEILPILGTPLKGH